MLPIFTFTSWLPFVTVLHSDDAAVVDLQSLVVLDVGAEVFLRLDVDEFIALLVIEGELVEFGIPALEG
jgi:hypothetical protein